MCRAPNATTIVRMSQIHHGALAAGTRIESCENASVLGVGGFGITCKGYDHSLHCDVAIKEYLPSVLVLRTAAVHHNYRSPAGVDTG